MAVHRYAYDAPRHSAFIGIFRGHIGRMRAAIAHRNAKALRGADGDIRAHGARFLQKRQGQRIGRHDANRLGRLQCLHLGREVAHMTIGAGILEDRAEHRFRIKLFRLVHNHLDPQRLGAGFHHGDVLRVAVAVDKEPLGLGLGHALRHGHGLGTGRGLVEQRRIGNLKPGQVADHGLEVQKRFKPALRNLGLVWRIGGVPGRVFKDIALDRRRRNCAVIALANQRDEHLVLVRDLAHVVQQLSLGLGFSEIERGVLTDRLGHGFVDQRVEIGHAQYVEHLRHFGGGRADMTPVREVIGEVVGRGERHKEAPASVFWRMRRPRGSARSPLKSLHRSDFRARLTQ